jgi:hypothetical protein
MGARLNENRPFLPFHTIGLSSNYCIFIQGLEEAMEQWVRVQNEHDRHVLAWLRERVGDATVAAAAQACARATPNLIFPRSAGSLACPCQGFPVVVQALME